jgi:probable rRNA maturation factor
VITFDYHDAARPEWLGGEIFVCVPEAIAQAHRFRTDWQSEVVRYIVHGILHLLGYADHTPLARQRMKREEDRLVRRLASECNFARVGGHRRMRRPAAANRALP